MVGKQLQTIEMALPLGSLEAYIHRVNQIPILSAEEEYSLALDLQENNNLEAARKLVMPHLRFVVKIARGYLGYGLSLADLIQEGSIGLLKAVKKFDPKIGVRLVSFAVHWIKAEIHEFILRNWRIVKIATTKPQRKLFFNLRNAKKRLGWFTHKEAADVAQALNVKLETVLEMEERLNNYDYSFDGNDNDTDEPTTLAPIKFLEDKNANPALLLEASDWQADNQQKLQDAFIKLDARSQDILKCRWLEQQKLTLNDLADKYNISAERIRQLEKQALEKLKKLLLRGVATK